LPCIPFVGLVFELVSWVIAFPWFLPCFHFVGLVLELVSLALVCLVLALISLLLAWFLN
jgi:hypothetical protein